MQYVQVKFSETERWYSYQWAGDKVLDIGDRVVVPANWANEYPSFATVVALGRNPDYTGPLATIMGLVQEDA